MQSNSNSNSYSEKKKTNQFIVFSARSINNQRVLCILSKMKLSTLIIIAEVCFVLFYCPNSFFLELDDQTQTRHSLCPKEQNEKDLNFMTHLKFNSRIASSIKQTIPVSFRILSSHLSQSQTPCAFFWNRLRSLPHQHHHIIIIAAINTRHISPNCMRSQYTQKSPLFALKIIGW